MFLQVVKLNNNVPQILIYQQEEERSDQSEAAEFSDEL